MTNGSSKPLTYVLDMPSLYNLKKLNFDTFSEIMGLPTDPSPFIAIVGVTAQNTRLSIYNCKMLAFCTLLARRLILLKWKDPLSPTFIQWIKEITQCLKLEKIRYSHRGSSQKFYAIWQHFLSFENIIVFLSFPPVFFVQHNSYV